MERQGMAIMGQPFERVREALNSGDSGEAIRLACKSRSLGEHRDAITAARQALATPDFYRSIGRDPQAIVASGIKAVASLCGEAGNG